MDCFSTIVEDRKRLVATTSTHCRLEVTLEGKHAEEWCCYTAVSEVGVFKAGRVSVLLFT